MAEIQHSFTKGMNRDISKDKFPHEAYYYLLNGRVMNDDNATLSDIINLKGNTEANINDNSLVRTNYSIIGYVVLENDIILFYAENTATGIDSLTTHSIIDRLVYQDNNVYSRTQIWNGQGLNFRTDKKIKAVSRYDSSNFEKIYWTDYNNPFRQANIAINISSQVADQFDMQGDLTKMFAPADFDFTSGTLKPGEIAYAYRLVKKNGYKTVFSDVSDLIPLGKNIAYYKSIRRAYGDATYNPDSAYNTGIGLVFAIYITNADYYTYYDYIEVVSLWYSSDSSIPDINIIKTLEIQNGVSTYRIIDDGTSSYGTLTLAEFTEQNYAFKAKDLVIKDNRLFAGNIIEEYFDIDELTTWTGKTTGDEWDARSYRFSNAVIPIAELTNSLGSVEYTLDSSSIDYTIVDSKADAINKYNAITSTHNDEHNSAGDSQMYQVDGSTVGGSGLNISYEFEVGEFYLATVTTDTPALDGTILNKEQLGIYKSFQRGEVYRFGIVFFDKKGRQSFVKWIGDIRMPTPEELTPENITSYNAGQINGFNLYPVFTVSNIPTISGETLDYQIVYVKRTEADKSIVAAGMILPTKIYSSDNGCRPSTNPNTIGNYYDSVGVGDGELNKYLVNFISPEISFRDKESLNGTFLHINNTTIDASICLESDYNDLATWTVLTCSNGISNPPKIIVRKYLNTSYWSSDIRTVIDSFAKTIPPTSLTFASKIGVDTYYHYGYIDYGILKTSAPSGTCLTMRLNNILAGSSGITSYYYGYLRKEVHNSAYGGKDYNSRQLNNYISASPKISGNINTVTCKKGDTFITIFEYGKFFFQDNPTTETSFGEYDLITCESSINCLFNTNDTYTRKYFINPLTAPAHINEDSYVDLNTGLSFTGMYGYNDAYSKLEDSKKFVPKPVLFENISEFTTRVKYSDVKIDNEDIDSWLIFRTNNFNDANKNYGQINKLIEFNDKVFSFQNNAMSIVSINPRVTQQSTDGVTIVLGTGEVIDKFYYISTDIGCQDNSDVIKSFSALYWLDKNKRKIYTFNGQIESITDLKGMHSYLKNNIYENSTFTGVYDVANSEILMTVKDTNPKTEFVADLIATNTWNLLGNTSIIEIPFVVGRVYKIASGYFTYVSKTATSYRFIFSHGTTLADGTAYDLAVYITERDNFTLAYNEKMQAFSGFYSFIPDLYIYHTRDYFTSENSRDLWQHNIGEEYNTFYGESFPTTLKLITNFGGQIQAEFTNIKFFAEVWNELGELQPNETITNISMKDSEQVSDDIILYPMHQPNDVNKTKYVIDTSSLRIGEDWYTGKVTLPEGLVINNNQLYRNNTIGNLTTSPPNTGWGIAELCNIRKTNNSWITQLPRCFYRDNYTDDYNYSGSNRFRSDWLEITLELKDLLPGINLSDRRLRLSDIKITYSPLQF